jgi:6-pyruvoyltetrahydropterin/6-carboxytetrahydropterin synthase
VIYTIAKEFGFSASHVLEGLPDGHQCGRLHGHNYVVELELRAEQLDERGFVLDYGELAPFKEWVDTHLDHRHLNDQVDGNPTAENLAAILYDAAKVLLIDAGDGLGRWWVSAVRVPETPKTVAEYRP